MEISFNKPFSERSNYMFWAHRNGHFVRDYILKHFYNKYFPNELVSYNDKFEKIKDSNEYDYKLWEQTGRRHNINFYKELCNSKIVDCCGGFFVGKRK